MRIASTAIMVSALGLGLTSHASATDQNELLRIAKDAYVYGYSLMTTEVTRVQMTNVDKVGNEHAPMGQFFNVKRYPPAGYRGVSAPNADTLYSIAWVDLNEPQVFSQPDMGDRYYLMPMYNLWMTIFDSPGARTTGGAEANYLLTGPDWEGNVPAGMKQIKSTTRKMLILGRTYANGSEKDYVTVNALQAQLKLTPLSAWGRPYTPIPPKVDPNPGFSMTDKPQTVILNMSTEAYFNKLASLMCEEAPPAPQDGGILAQMMKLGIEPCKPFKLSKLDPELQAKLSDLPEVALKEISAAQSSLGRKINGWTYTKGLGVYGTDYMKRAVVAAFGWPANVEQDAVYPYTTIDSNGQKLNGANKYTLTFPKGLTPPANGFWSITMYEVDKGWWFVPNPLNKFTVSPRNDLQYNTDGSLTLYFQHSSPGPDKEANWLPAPKGDFLPMLRMYWPKGATPSILDGSWTPAPVVRVN